MTVWCEATLSAKIEDRASYVLLGQIEKMMILS